MKQTRLVLSKLLSFSVAVLALQGCGTLHQHLEASRFDTPETNGVQRRFKFHADAAQSHDYTAVPNTAARPPDLTHPSSSDETQVGLDLSAGVIENLDIGLKANGPQMLTVKLQLLGPSQTEAKEGDVSVAILGGIGTGSETSESSSISLGSQSYSWGGSLKTKALDVAVIAGTRLSSRVLLYGGAFYTNYRFDIQVDQGQSFDGTQGPSSASAQTSGFQRGANVGLQVFFGASPVYMIAEGVYSHLTSLSLDHELWRIGYAFGASF